MRDASRYAGLHDIETFTATSTRDGRLGTMNYKLALAALAALFLVGTTPSLRAAGADCTSVADTSCIDRLLLQAASASGNTLTVNNSSGTQKFNVDYAGAMTAAGTNVLSGATTISGTLAQSGASTITADMTFSGNGIDLLFNADNQNTIGAATKGAAGIYTYGVTNVTGQALTITGASGITMSGVVALGSNVPTQTTSRTAWIMASSITTGSFTGIFELKNTKTTIQLADASADDHVYVVWPLPDDFAQATSGVAVKVSYMCDDATVTEGEWDVKYLAITPGTDADAALGNELTVLDTPVQNQWMLTGAMVIPPSAIVSADTLLALDIYHDVTDPLCNGSVLNFLGVQLGYTTDKNY